MNILHPGHPADVVWVINFICNNCGCVWEATENECDLDNTYQYYLCRCPYCHDLVKENKRQLKNASAVKEWEYK